MSLDCHHLECCGDHCRYPFIPKGEVYRIRDDFDAGMRRVPSGTYDAVQLRRSGEIMTAALNHAISQSDEKAGK